jgi:hypothetical protein
MLIKQNRFGEERYVKGELFVCMQCAKEAIQNCKNVLGYLKLAEHCGYRRDATMCNILFLDGYMVIPRAQWEIALFPFVGQNGNRHVCRETDRQSGRNLGVARLVASTWQVGVAKRGKGRE